MSLSQSQKATIALVMFGISGFIIYNTFFKSNVVPFEDTMEGEGVVSDTQDIIDLAEKFDGTTINASVFSSPLFRSLEDARAPISQETQGKTDPFQFGR